MYQRRHKDLEDDLYNFLEDLYELSSKKYINTTLKESDCFEVRNDLIRIQNYAGFVEEYIYDHDKRSEVIEKLKEIKTISILSHKKRDYKVLKTHNNIELNPTLTDLEAKKVLYKVFDNKVINSDKEDN